jgi:hypothetical protein
MRRDKKADECFWKINKETSSIAKPKRGGDHRQTRFELQLCSAREVATQKCGSSVVLPYLLHLLPPPPSLFLFSVSLSSSLRRRSAPPALPLLRRPRLRLQPSRTGPSGRLCRTIGPACGPSIPNYYPLNPGPRSARPGTPCQPNGRTKKKESKSRTSGLKWCRGGRAKAL